MTSTSKKTTAAQADVMKPVEDAVAAGKETIEQFVKVGTETATKNYEQAIAMTKEQVEKASANLFRNYGELNELNKDNVEAVVAFNTKLVKAYEEIGKEIASFTQTSFESQVEATKAIFSVKSLRDFVDLQSNLARVQFDQVMAEGAKITEMSVKVANEAYEPLQARMNVTVEKMLKPVAA
ncbi:MULTISPECIES: phasin family protein [Limibacillus]|jgi:phasin family protein|uniref:Phasin family protein n=1 Tax=Limibacillus halophilus TaxID=1579333 RepID=A0A839SNF2_9PROT|nr:phasin family protein [Limibacillus halophilus]MBB3064427.1 phasin family protein [Limibacillus halophilus]